jgi:DNA-binding transcriptional LysR family regulator
MDHLENLRIFCTVFEVRSFTRAAEILGMSTPNVSRSITKLERTLGVRLFQRTTRHISTTEAAERFFVGCVRILAELGALETEARNGIIEPTGVLRLVAHTTATMNVLVPLIADFKKQFPSVYLDITLTERPVDLVEDGFDLGLLLPSMLTTDRAITRLLMRVTVALVSTPEYLASHGCPRTPQDLEGLRFVAFSPAMQAPSLRLRRNNEEVSIDLKFEITSNNSALRKEMVVRGFGLGVLPELLIADEIKTGRLVRVLDEYDVVDGGIELRLAYSAREFMPAKVRAFVDYAISYYGAEQIKN